MNKSLQKQGWKKMRSILVKEMPLTRANQMNWLKGAIIILLLLVSLAGAFFTGRYVDYTADTNGKIENQSQDFFRIKSEISLLHSQMREKDILLTKLMHLRDKNEISSDAHVNMIRFPYNYSPLSISNLHEFSPPLIGRNYARQISTTTRKNIYLEKVASIEDIEVFMIEIPTDQLEFSSIQTSSPTQNIFQKVKPSFFVDLGYTSTIDRGKTGLEANIGVIFFPDSRLSVFLGSGLRNQKTSLINQTTAGKASLAEGLSGMSIAYEIDEESNSFSNYIFANVQMGASYQTTPKIKIFSSLKGSYLLDKYNFSEASIETPDNTIRIKETLSSLVEENQVHRWGFSGLVGAEYEISKKLGVQFTYNKYITPLVSSLPIENNNNPVTLSDYGKVSMSYNF